MIWKEQKIELKLLKCIFQFNFINYLLKDDYYNLFTYSKLHELEEECRVVSNNMKSLEVSEQEAKQREENFAELMREYTAELKEVNNNKLNYLF